MRTKRIELEGSHGHVAIERPRNSSTIRIDSIIRNSALGSREKIWKTWEVEASTVGYEELFEIAMEVQRRCDGVAGTNSDIHDYFREMQRFAD